MSDSHPNYELFEEIGRGDDTIVFRAHDLALGRDVAIKTLDAQRPLSEDRRSRFVKEAQFLAQSQHNGVLRIHAVIPERNWIVMELMQGDLATQIRTASLPSKTVRSILRQTLPALSFLHSKGKLHGAICPSNILIDDEGSVRLSDFEETNVDGELRAPTGSKKYLAPEMLQSSFGQLGFRSDLYCLGFTALELLAGPRFNSLLLDRSAGSVDPDVAWLRIHSGESPLPSVSELLPEVPSDLAAAIDSMLIKSVDQRAESATNVLSQLDDQAKVLVQPIQPNAASTAKDALDMLPAAVREIAPPSIQRAGTTEPSPGQPLPHKNRKRPSSLRPSKAGQHSSSKTTVDPLTFSQQLNRPIVLYPICGLILLFALGIGLAFQPAKEPELLAVNPKPIEPINESNPPEKDATDVTPNNLPPDELPSNDPLPSGPLPSQDPSEGNPAGDPSVVDATESADNASEEALPIAWPEHKPDPNENKPDVIASDSSKGDQPLPELEEVNETGTEVNPSLEMELSQSNGLESMLRLVSNKIKVDTSELLAEFKGEAELVIDGGGFMNEVSDVALDPNGRWVAASGAKVVRIWDVQSGELLETLRGDQSRAAYGDCHSLTFSPDGQFLCVGINDYQPHGSIRIYRTDNFADIDALLPGANSPTRKLQFSDDGKWLVTADAEGRVHLYDWESRGLMRSVAVADPQSPIIDELQFAQDNEANIVIFGIAANGPFLLSAPELERLTANSAMPDTMRSWMFDTLGRQLTLPFQTVKDPRVVELELPNDIWCSAGIGQVDGNSRYWVSLWPSRSMDSPIFKQPLLTYTGHKWNVTAVDLAPDLGWVASADKFGEVHLWQTSDGSLLHRFTCQGEPIYDAAFDSTSERIGFGTKSYRADQWDRNNFGSLEHLLDLRARSVFDIVAETEFIPIQETPFTSGATLDVIRPEGESSYSIVRKEKGSIVSAYQFTTGRNPTAFSFVEPGTLGVESPVLVSDSEGLFALWDSETDELKRAFIGHESLVSSISVAPAGNVVLTSSTDRTMRLWSLTDYKPTGIFDFKFENSVVKKIRPGSTSAEAGVRPGDQIVSIDELSMTEMQNLMLVGAFDYVPGDRVQVRLLRDGQSIEYEMQLDPGYDFSEPLLSVFIGDDDKWIMWSPLGYYDASPGAEELIGWHVNRGPDKSAQYFPVQQFRKQLYRPDIINQILGGKQVDKAVLMANADIDVDPIDFRSPSDLALYHPPKIEFESPRHNATIPSGDVDFTALVTSANGLPIREVTVLVNGVSEAVLIPPNPSAMKFRIDRSLRLEGGQNKIELIAANSESTSRLSIRVNVESTVPAKRIQLNILAIDTNSAGITADRFAQTLLQQDDNRLYSTVQTNVLQGRNATRDAILEGFQWLVDQTQPDDTAAVYISGTGYSDPDDLFFLGTHDIDPKRLRSTAVSWREFIDTIHLDLPRSKRLVFLDIAVTNASAQTASRNPLLDLATPELGTTFFSTNALQVANQSNRSNNDRLLTTALDRLMGDPRSDTEPRVGDSLLSNREVTESWSRQMKSLSNGQLYPIAFVNPSSERLHVLELTVE